MKNLTGKIAAIFIAGVLTLGTFASSAAASTTVIIRGNGAFSDNEVSIRQDHRVSVNQSNRANIDNSVDIRANTGFNRASFNTDGDVFIRTGDIDSVVRILNLANFNKFDHHFFHRSW